jgi:TrmH family RNA methyltransferase
MDHPNDPKTRPWARQPVLTGLQNAKVKQAVNLRERRHRDALGLTLVDGRRELACALDGGHVIRQVFACEPALDEDAAALARRAYESGAEVIPVSERVMARIAYGDRNEGLLGVLERPDTSLQRLSPGEAPLLLVVEGLEKPGNLGALLRSADAAGATGVIVCDARTDVFNPNAIRASLGTIFTVPLAESGGPEALQWLRQRHIRVFAASPHASQPYTACDLTVPCALVFGSEHAGLTPLWMQAADERLMIPMRGKADSLNLAMSATLFLFEAVRQRVRVGQR